MLQRCHGDECVVLQCCHGDECVVVLQCCRDDPDRSDQRGPAPQQDLGAEPV